MTNHCLLVTCWLVLLTAPLAFGVDRPKNETGFFQLLTPRYYDVRPILRTFVALRNQWCPLRRHKRMYVLNYNTGQQSQEILTEILKMNEPPKIVSNKPTDITYYTYEARRCAIVMALGYEKLKAGKQIYYGSRYFIFHPKLQHNTFMEDLLGGASVRMDKAYHIVYGPSSVDGVYHKNFFTNHTISLDPRNPRVADDLRDLHGKRLSMWLQNGSPEVTSFDAYLGETIARVRNASFSVVMEITTDTDYGVIHAGVPLEGSDQIVAIGSTFVAALVPRSKPKPVISVLVDPFDYYTWIGLLAMIVVMALVLARFGARLHRLHTIEVSIELVMCILGGPSRTYGGWLENHLITTFCLLSIVLVSSYQSLIISYLSVIRYYPEINTAEEVRNRCTFPSDTAFGRQLDLELSTKHTQYSAIFDERFCYLYNSRDSHHITTLLLAHFRNYDHVAMATFRHKLRIADDTFYKFQLLYYFFHKSIVRELFPFFISAFFEAGLFDQYYRNKRAVSLEYHPEMYLNDAFSVPDLSIVWYLFLAGNIISSGCFLLELLLYHFPAGELWEKMRRAVSREGSTRRKVFSRAGIKRL